MSCPNCPTALLFKSFYDSSLSENYVKKAHGIGFSPLFLLSVFVSIVLSLRVLFFMQAFTPEAFTEIISKIPDIQIQNGQIISPKNFLQRFNVADGLHLTLDTTDNQSETLPLAPNEIYVSKNSLQLSTGQKVELFPLNKIFGTDNITLTQENMNSFFNKIVNEIKYLLPSFIFMFAIPVMFVKYILTVYVLALFSYLLTIFPTVPMPFEERMRLSAISLIPVFVFNFIFKDLFDVFYLNVTWGGLVALIYMMYYISKLPKQA